MTAAERTSWGTATTASRPTGGLVSAGFAVGSAGALMLAATATVTPDAARWFGLRGPHCPLGSCLGPLACPGCGLVRSVAATVQGDLGAAWTYHPAGPVVAALFAGTALLHLDILRRARELPAHRWLRRAGRITFLVAVLGGWIFRLLT